MVFLRDLVESSEVNTKMEGTILLVDEEDQSSVSIGIASSNQVQRQQQRDEPVRENTHLVLDTLASRLRSYHSIVGVESFCISDHKDPTYIHPEYCLYEWMKLSVKGQKSPRKEPMMKGREHIDRKSTRLNSSHPVSSRMPSSA